MKQLPAGLQSHLESGATTLCWCWRITPHSGPSLGFTDHDRDLAFDGTTFEAASGCTASEIRSTVGLNVDDLEVESALVSSRLSEPALASGDFDDAAIEFFRVNWGDTTQRVLMRKGSLGEVRRSGTAFTAEVRGLSHYLQQPKGRLFQFGCDAEVGDSRCGVNLALPNHHGVGEILTLESDRLFIVSGLGSFVSDWFTRGLLTMTTGNNAGRRIEVKRHSNHGSIVRLEIWQSFATQSGAGDGFSVTVGCDKQISTCRDRFQNALNYRGFPHMPGNDFLSSPSAS